MGYQKGHKKHDVSADQLHQLYNIECLSTYEIGTKLGINPRVIRHYMEDYGIKSRSRRDAARLTQQGTLNFISISDKEKEIIKGELLGDGCVRGDLRNNNGYCYYGQSSKYREYLEWLQSQLPSISFGNINEVYHKKYDCTSYTMNSHVHPDLTEFRKSFYIKDDIKKIPENLIITPTILKFWYLGDGTYGYVSAGRKPNGEQKKSWQMCIAACQFSKESLQEIIIPQLHDLGIKATAITKSGTNHLRISSYSHERFFEYIGPCDVPVYDYKFTQEAYTKWKADQNDT